MYIHVHTYNVVQNCGKAIIGMALQTIKMDDL